MSDYQGLLLDIGGVVHNTGVRMVERLARREPAMGPVIEEIGGIATDRDELWQRMLRRQVTERDYWAQRAAELGAAVGETWDTRALMDRIGAAVAAGTLSDLRDEVAAAWERGPEVPV